MAIQYARADLVICRAGALTIAELAAAGVASVLIPLPIAVDDHQTRNAEALERAGAARLVPDDQMTGGKLAALVAELAGSSGVLERMGEAARGFAKPGAARRAAEILEEVAGAARDFN